MPITVDTANANTRMCTIDQVADELGLSATEKTNNTDMINRLIDAASDYIRSYTGRVFRKETVTETLVSNGEHRLILSRTPIISITHVKLDGTEVDSANYTIENADAGFIFREKSWSDTQLYTGDYVMRPSRFGKYDYEVKYEAGYVMPDESGTTLPHDLQKACIDIVKSKYLSRQDHPNIAREEIGDASVWYARGRYDYQSIENLVMPMLDKYAIV